MIEPIPLTAYALAQRYAHEIRELTGDGQHHPWIQWAFLLCGYGPNTPDETAWCSAFVNAICWELRLPRSKSALARSWLAIGIPVPLDQATVGFDIVVLSRGTGGVQPGPENLTAPGHVGFFAGLDTRPSSPRPDGVLVLAGNQGDAVSLDRFPIASVLGVRRVR